MKVKLGGKIMIAFIELTAKTCSQPIDYSSENKKAKSQQRFRGKKHNVFTEEINKTALSANDD